jgi:hypothetical protein
MALPFEHPKLSVGVAVGIDPDWPRRMETLWQRTRGAKLIEAQPVGLVTRR